MHLHFLCLLQVDDDGESYWVFESRDVRVIQIRYNLCRDTFLSRRPAAIAACEPH